jgi:hypothetical protein
MQHSTLTSIPVFTVESPFVMKWQLFMSFILIFCAVFIPYDAGFIIPTFVLYDARPVPIPTPPPARPVPIPTGTTATASSPTHAALPRLTRRLGTKRLQADEWSRTTDVRH